MSASIDMGRMGGKRKEEGGGKREIKVSVVAAFFLP